MFLFLNRAENYVKKLLSKIFSIKMFLKKVIIKILCEKVF